MQGCTIGFDRNHIFVELKRKVKHNTAWLCLVNQRSHSLIVRPITQRLPTVKTFRHAI